MEDGADPADPTGPVWVVVVAAGSGRRFGGAKQYERLAGRRVLDWSLDAARAVADGVVLVVAEGASLDEPVDHVVVGGATRSASVRSGLAAVPADAAVVLVHDGARPLASGALFARVVEAVQDGAPAVVPAVTPVDTIRERGGTTLDRDALAAVQTPQGFRADVLLAAHRGEAEASDDAALVEADGHEV
ncbi:MAG: 2-C-methyl-D-erythritol 4-phosphate cytidylyltransferase, partial [Actinomycetota bacterium]